MQEKSKQPRQKVITTAAVVAVVILLLFLYARVDPADSIWGRFFPKCPVKMLTGLQCPACGIQRAAHALLHGDLIGALRQNWFLLFSVGYVICLILTKYLSQPFSTIRKFFWGRGGCTLYITFYCLWFIVRNLLHV
ncbi:MAG: DUF2752 domain-containing protein [Bacteroides sp.]|nr:DUF2752 domain-containing protein [Bacteroides sp.]